MSFIKQILSPFIEFEEEGRAAEGKRPQPPSNPAKVVANSQEANHPLVNEPGAIRNRVDQQPSFSPTGRLSDPLPEHTQYFQKLIDEANRTSPSFAGADFKEFVDNKIDIDDIADEELKYKTAFNILQSSGLTREKLISTAHEYLELIGRDLNTFQSAHLMKYKAEVGDKEKVVQGKVQELQQLQQKINMLKSEINALSQDVKLVRDKYDLVKNSFLLAGERKQKEIQDEISKINRYFPS